MHFCDKQKFKCKKKEFDSCSQHTKQWQLLSLSIIEFGYNIYYIFWVILEWHLLFVIFHSRWKSNQLTVSLHKLFSSKIYAWNIHNHNISFIIRKHGFLKKCIPPFYSYSKWKKLIWSARTAGKILDSFILWL